MGFVEEACEHVEVFTYKELEQRISDFRDTLSDDVKHRMLVENHCEFDEYVLSSIKAGDIVEINFTINDFKILTPTLKSTKS